VRRRTRTTMGWSLSAWWRADRRYFEAFRLLRAGKPVEAAKAFDAVLATFPHHARAYVQRAVALAAANRVGEAVRSARRAADLAPRSHAPLLFLGRIQFDAGHYEEARKAFSAAARLDPENRLVQAYLGLALLAVGRAEEGAELLRAHLLYGYEGLEGRLLALAEQYLWEHREQARSLEEQLTPDEGGREERPAGLGLRLASAIRLAILWPLARLRGPAAAWRLRAEEAMSVQEWDAAISALEEAEKAGVDQDDVAFALGLSQLEARRPKLAVEQFRRLPQNATQDPEAALLFGAALFDAEQYEEAREPLERAARHFRRDYLPAYFRGLCEVALGRRPSATEWFTEAVERLNPHIAEKRFEEMMRARAEVREA
jgi:tetratricopeptide (TPR) repeat protein